MRIQKNTLFLVVAAAVFVHSSAQIDNGQLKNNTTKTKSFPSLDVCGKGNASDERVINGKPAELGEFPWLAAIGHSKQINGGFQRWWFCGGSLITDQYVITAAHCLTNLPNSWPVNTVRLGELNLNPAVNDGASPQDFEVEKTTYHDLYDQNKHENDIGLIKLREKINFLENKIVPICLPTKEFLTKTFEGYNPIVAGWEQTNFNYDAHGHQMTAEVQIKNTQRCRQNLTPLNRFRDAIIDNRVLCASSPGKDACKINSGSPLMLYRNYGGYGNLFLMGIVSYGYNCNEENYPGVYVRVAEYMSWIINKLEI